MSTRDTESMRSHRHTVQRTITEFVTGYLASAIRRFAAAAGHHRDMRRLSAIGDRGLHDIGLSRSSIESAVRYGRSERSWEEELNAMNLRQLADLPMGREPIYRDKI